MRVIIIKNNHTSVSSLDLLIKLHKNITQILTSNFLYQASYLSQVILFLIRLKEIGVTPIYEARYFRGIF